MIAAKRHKSAQHLAIMHAAEKTQYLSCTTEMGERRAIMLRTLASSPPLLWLMKKTN